MLSNFRVVDVDMHPPESCLPILHWGTYRKQITVESPQLV